MLNISITGASGLIGQNLILFLPKDNYKVLTIGRDDTSDVLWSPDQGEIDSQLLDDLDVMVHLAGESIANKRWSEKQKSYILENRKNSAQLIAKTCIEKNIKTVFVASAIGYYGHRPEEICTENSEIGQGFTCDVCSEIEGEFLPLIRQGVRVVFMRFGVVLSSKGGALPKMALPFKLLGGGPVGDGQQKISWIDVDDAALAILHLLKNKKISGPVNITSPDPITNEILGRSIARQFKMPYWFPFPKFMVKLTLGEMGESLLLDSIEVQPEKLLRSGFHFSFPNIRNSLKNQYK
jgi:uncharacterized protein (TIGR01777 family)